MITIKHLKPIDRAMLAATGIILVPVAIFFAVIHVTSHILNDYLFAIITGKQVSGSQDNEKSTED